MNGSEIKYKAFISYSHLKTKNLASALQEILRLLAKPWFKPQAFEIFRDETNLSLSPNLWNTIEAALFNSDFLIFLASPEAANSKWVLKEIKFWLTHKSRESLLIVVTSGELLWDDNNNDFNWQITDCIPQILKGVFDGEPLYSDLRAMASSLNITINNEEFIDLIKPIAAKLHDKTVDELFGDIKAKHEKRIRLKNLFIGILLILFSASTILAITTIFQRNTARKNANANALVSQALLVQQRDPTKSFEYLLEAYNLRADKDVYELMLDLYRENSFYLSSIDSIKLNFLYLSPQKDAFIDWNPHLDSIVTLRHLDGTLIRKIIDKKNIDNKSNIAFSASGDTIITGGKWIKFWGNNGELLNSFKLPKEVDELKIAPKNAFFAITLNYDEKNFKVKNEIVYLKNSKTKWSLQLLNWEGKAFIKRNFDQKISDITINNSHIAILLEDNSVHMMDLNGNIRKVYQDGKDSDLYKIFFSPNGDYILTTSSMGVLKILDLHGKLISEFKISEKALSNVDFSKNMNNLLISCHDNTIRLIDIDGYEITVFRGHSNQVYTANFLKNSNFVISTGEDNTIRKWLVKGDLVDHFNNDEEAVSFKFNIEDRYYYIFERFGFKKINFDKRVLSAYKRKKRHAVSKEMIGVTTKFNPVNYRKMEMPYLFAMVDSKGKIILADGAGKIEIFDSGGRMLDSFYTANDFITAIACDSATDLLAIEDKDFTIGLWTYKGELKKVFKGHSDFVRSISFSPIDGNIASADQSGKCYIWNKNGEIKLTLTSSTGYTFLTYSKSGKYILISDDSGKTILYNEKGEIITSMQNPEYNPIVYASFSHKEDQIAISSTKHDIYLYDFKGHLNHIYRGFKSAATKIEFSNDDKYIIAGSENGSIKIWNVVESLEKYIGGSLNYLPSTSKGIN